ncbi:hypothetical protein SAMN04488058_10490 [Deinococcus reticulitermitis]|uniref:Uncharacterized protein n=1 Tax=Deinococcus reticulitermitis TaxID=856736 RepID=A0A1H6WLF4_9DEIO|nr:hypothetical protein [Deinococcus reticulitermitis]SEJ13205.1 hypothetical protein SAMN04488058_10490 [Deinococcus reticulitermitis]
MSSYSGGGFFRRSHSSGHRRGGVVGGLLGHSHSSGRRRGGMMGGLMGHSHSSHGRGRYVKGGHYRPVKRGGCLGAFLVGAALAVGGLTGLVSLIA